MEKSKLKIISIISVSAAICIAAIIVVLSYTFKLREENPYEWVLKAENNTVVLLNNNEIIEVFSNIALDTLPQDDIKHLENGISFLTKEEALIAVEDYDG